MDFFCENNLLDSTDYVRYKVTLDGATNWGKAFVSLVEGHPSNNLPRSPFSMPCQKDRTNGDFLCIFNYSDHGPNQNIFRWHTNPQNNWAEDEITLSFKKENIIVSYDCHE